MRRVAVIRGDGGGVGRHLKPTLALLDALAREPLAWEERRADEAARIRQTRAALFGSVPQPSLDRPDYVSPLVRLRQELGLFAVVYPLPDATECFFVGVERMAGPDVAIAERHISRAASERVSKLAFELALARHLGDDDDVQHEFRRTARGPKKPASVTVGHKINVLPLTEGMFLGAARDVAKAYEGRVAFQDRPADSLASDLVQKSTREQLDVVLTTNLFGDLLGDVGAGISGGLSRMASLSVGEEGWIMAHSSNMIAGGDDHPAGLVRAGIIILGALGEHNAAYALDRALNQVLESEDAESDRFFDKLTQLSEYEKHLLDISQGS